MHATFSLHNTQLVEDDSVQFYIEPFSSVRLCDTLALHKNFRYRGNRRCAFLFFFRIAFLFCLLLSA